jgi:hypothetical protein
MAGRRALVKRDSRPIGVNSVMARLGAAGHIQDGAVSTARCGVGTGARQPR